MTPPPMLTSFHSKRIILENYKQDNNINDSMRFNKNKIDDNFNINYQGQKNFNKSSNTSGTFAYLMDRTQDIQKKYKKYSEKMLIGNNIFTHENYNYKKQRKYVNIEKERKNYFYAGNNIPVRDEIVYFNLYSYFILFFYYLESGIFTQIQENLTIIAISYFLWIKLINSKIKDIVF